MIRPLIGWLLHVANSRPPSLARDEFYALKDYLCHRYGTFVEVHWQQIDQPCWGCDGTGIHRHGRDCHCCGGSGVHRRFWSELELWTIGRWRFHRPRGRSYSPPPVPVQIRGPIRKRDYGRGADEAALWLALVFDRALFARLLTGTCHHGAYAYPLLLVQRAVFGARMNLGRLRPRRCIACGRRTWPRWSRIAAICRACAARPRPAPEDIPF